MKFNIPIFLTMFRVILIPFFVIAFYLPIESSPFITTFIFFIAGVTDWLDGYLARKWKQTTRFGAFLDPVADKVMVVTAIIMISREIIISALREWMAELGERSKVAVSWWGKWKTTAQMLALGGLLWRYNNYMEIAAIILLYIAAILTVWSMLQYLQAAKGSLLDDLKL